MSAKKADNKRIDLSQAESAVVTQTPAIPAYDKEKSPDGKIRYA